MIEPGSEQHPSGPAEVRVPGGAISMWRLVKIGYANEPRLMIGSLALQLLAALPRPLVALWLLLLTQGITASDPVRVHIALGGMVTSACAGWLLSMVAGRLARRFRGRLIVALVAHIARLQASISTIEHQERPEYLDRLALLRQKVFVLDHLYSSLVITAIWIFQLCVVLALLSGVSPLLPLLVLFTAPIVVAAIVLPRQDNVVEEQVAPHRRLTEHLFELSTTAGAAQDVRIAGIRSEIARSHEAEWRRWYRPMRRRTYLSSGWNALAWGVFGLAYGLTLLYVVFVLDAPASEVVLVLATGVQMSDFVAATVNEVGFIRGVFLTGARRLAWLEDYAAVTRAAEDHAAPELIRSAVSFENVSFRYPGETENVLEKINLRIPAGSVVAIVGENGAGKSTLVKLLAKFYEPTSGRVLIDDVPLAKIHATEWRQRLSGSFQDFARFEFTLGLSVGVGDLTASTDDASIGHAIMRGGADDLVTALPHGTQTQLGSRWPEGQELSFGQWQRVALSRGFMNTNPLLLLLDEPTAALDTQTEHALFERFATAAAAEKQAGRITMLVSHRFSTVRMADLIIVLDGKRIVEQGDHDSLLCEGGLYAKLYSTQEHGYRPQTTDQDDTRRR